MLPLLQALHSPGLSQKERCNRCHVHGHHCGPPCREYRPLDQKTREGSSIIDSNGGNCPQQRPGTAEEGRKGRKEGRKGCVEGSRAVETWVFITAARRRSCALLTTLTGDLLVKKSYLPKATNPTHSRSGSAQQRDSRGRTPPT